MPISQGDKVFIHYILTNDAGERLDSSEEREPLSYTAGSGEIIPSLDNALLGKDIGDHVDVTIPPTEGYGEYLEAAVQKIEKENFADIPNLQVGMPLQAQTPEGTITVFVREVSDDHVIIDGNHPLAGETLNFSVDIQKVEKGEKESNIILPR